MANIGFFRHTRRGYEGMITTLTLCATVQIVPNRKKKATSPDYFIKAGDSDLGVAWKAQTKDDEPRDFIKCLLDDPSFPKPIQAALFDHNTGADLVWSRLPEA